MKTSPTKLAKPPNFEDYMKTSPTKLAKPPNFEVLTNKVGKTAKS